MMQPRALPLPQHSRFNQYVRLLLTLLAASGVVAGCSPFRSKPATTPTAGVVARENKPEAGDIGSDVVPAVPPGSGTEVVTPAAIRPPSPPPQSTVLSAPAPPLLTLEVPEPGQTIYSPVYVRGEGPVPFERTLEVQILGVTGEIMGRGPVHFDPVTPVGERAAYEGTLDFRQPGDQQLGSVRVLMQNPKDHSIVDYAQVLVTLLPAGTGPTQIRIDVPTAGSVIGNPVRVKGAALASQNQVTVRLKAGPAILGAKTISLSGEIGRMNPFGVDLSYGLSLPSAGDRPGYPAPSESVPGHIEVFYRSPKDGRIAEIASVPVVIPK